MDGRFYTQIGASAFRVDLGVVHPDAPGIYLAGIECDGATYHRSATARDRDKLREQVLRELGWEILRVWSTDWWIDPEGTLDRLDVALQAVLNHSREQRAVARPAEHFPPAPAADDTAETDEMQAAVAVGGTQYRRYEPQAPPAGSEVRPSDGSSDASRFFERSYSAELSAIIGQIVEAEGPILDEALARRIARLHGWGRTSPRIADRVTRLAARAFKRTKDDAGTFFWPSALDPGQPVRFRPAAERGVDEICIQELVSVAMDVLGSGRTGEEAIAAMAKTIGLQRLRAPSRARLQAALARAQRARSRM